MLSILSSFLTLCSSMRPVNKRRRLDERRRQIARQTRLVVFGRPRDARPERSPLAVLRDYDTASLPELKNGGNSNVAFNLGVTMDISTTSNTGFPFVPFPRGSTKFTRTGRSVKIHCLYYKGRVQYAPNMLNIPCTVAQIGLMVDLQFRGAFPTQPEVFAPLAGQVSGRWMLNEDNSHRYKLLRLWTHTFIAKEQDPGAFSYGGQTADFEWFIPMNLTLTIAGAAGQISDLRGPVVPFLIYGATHAGCTFFGSSRWIFSDD